MSAGYGRGYYGEDQLAKPPRRRGNGWIKFALVVGVGAVVWYMWPRGAQDEPRRDGDVPKPPPPSPQPDGQIALPITQPPPSLALPAIPTPPPLLALVPAGQTDQHAQIAQVAQGAPSRGYPSLKEYEDAVVASARQLRDSGAKVVLAPHLAHLTSRL